MPEKLGNGGYGPEDYDINTGKYKDDGVVNKEDYSGKNSIGNDLNSNQKEYFKDSKVRDQNGNLLVLYHGTPNGGFEEFKPFSYFTTNKQYASGYQSANASSRTTKFGLANDKPQVYEVYLNMKKPFDTRDPECKRIFEEEFYYKWGTGTPLQASGLPDWNDGDDLIEFLEEMGYDYDGLVLDEGATMASNDKGMVEAGKTQSRGISYVPFFSNQIKSTNNLNPTSSNNIYDRSEEEQAMKLFKL